MATVCNSAPAISICCVLEEIYLEMLNAEAAHDHFVGNTAESHSSYRYAGEELHSVF